MQTTNSDVTLSMNIVGKRDGRPFRHTLRFDMAGMTKMERDSLYQQTLRTLGILGISNVPGLKKADLEGTGSHVAVQNSKITFRCETCTGRGRVEIYGNDFTSTRSFNTKRDTQPFFSANHAIRFWRIHADVLAEWRTPKTVDVFRKNRRGKRSYGEVANRLH